MADTPNATLTDVEVLRRVQLLGDAITQEQHQTKVAIGLRQPLRDPSIQVRLLLDVERLLLDGISSRAAFVGWMSLYIRKCLLESMECRRTPIVLAALRVLETLAENSGGRGAAAVVCSWFLPCAVQLASSSSIASVVPTAAMRALLTVAKKCMFTLESVNHLVCDCTAASPAVRRCSLEVLRSYLEAVKGTTAQMFVHAYNAALHRMLAGRMRDAAAEVRIAARRCFWALHLLEPASTEALFRTLPVGVQRQLAAERAGSMQELKAVESSHGGSLSSPPASKRANTVVSHPQLLDTTTPSRTFTMKDDLQCAVASRARTLTARARSSGRIRRQLLRSSKEGAHSSRPDATVSLLSSQVFARGSTAAATASAHLHAPLRRSDADASLLTSMESTDWSVRRAAVLEWQRLCEVGSLAGVDMCTLLAALLRRLQDIHFRVVEAAQSCLSVMMAQVPTATEKVLRSLLPSLLGALVRNTCHVRPNICTSARRVIDCIVRTHEPPQEVLTALLHTADDIGGSCGGLAQRCAEVFHYLVLVRPSFLVDVSTMGIAVRSILAHLRVLAVASPHEKASSGLRAAHASWLNALGAVFLACPESFRQMVTRLEPSRVEEVRAALREGSGLLEECREINLSDLSGVCDKWLCCRFGEELKANTMSIRSVTGAGEVAFIGDREAAGDRGLFGVTTLSNGALEKVVVQLREFFSVSGTCPSSSRADGTHSDYLADAVSAPLSRKTPIAAPHATPKVIPSNALVCGERNQGSSIADRRVYLSSSDGADVNKDPVAHYLRERPRCRSGEERRKALLSLAEALRLGGASSERAASPHRLHCVPEEVEGLIMHWERDLLGVEGEMYHSVRCAVLEALQALLQWPVARSMVARQLTRVLVIIRAGLDDPFLEVQLQAASCLDTLLVATKLPADLCLSAIASCLMRWLEGPTGDEGTAGWVELVHMIVRVLKHSQPTLAGAKGTNSLGSDRLPIEAEYQRASILTTPVLHRVVAALNRCLGHCHVDVRLCAVLVLVGIRRSLGDTAALPLLAPLPAVEMRLVDVYMDKKSDERPWRLMV